MTLTNELIVINIMYYKLLQNSIDIQKKLVSPNGVYGVKRDKVLQLTGMKISFIPVSCLLIPQVEGNVHL